MSTQDITPDPYALSAAWVESPYKDLVCPSGQKCFVRKIAMEDLVGLGIVDQTDTPTGTAVLAADEAKGKSPQDHRPKKLTKAEQLAADVLQQHKNAENMDKHFGMINKVVLASVLKPELHPIPEPDPTVRVVGRAYVDQIALNDKMEIFKFAMSSTVGSAETFRPESSDDVGRVEDGESVQLSAE